MMLDVTGLPKNVNGFRTTHTCELCGFEPKTKNKYREKQDHLVMKHFKERIDKIFPHCRPYACPANDCAFTGKDKQALLRHYTGKHGILERYLREALAEKGIHYNPHENGKRRNSDSNGHGGKAKAPRLSISPPTTNVVNQLTEVNENGNGKVVSARPNTEELRKEVEAMMRSFQPVVEQPIVLQAKTTASNAIVTSASPVTIAQTNSTSSSLPTIVLSAVANATAASIAANNGNNRLSPHQQQQQMTVSLPTQPANVPTITVQANQQQHQQQQQQQQLPKIPSFTSSQPLPLEALINGGTVITSDGSGTVTLPSIRIVKANLLPSSSPVVENEDVMWSANVGGGGTGQAQQAVAITSRSSSSSSASSASSTSSNGGSSVASGPAVVVEAAHTVPVAYIENVDASAFAAGSTINLDNIDYDYLYTTNATNVTEVRERQLDFCML